MRKHGLQAPLNNLQKATWIILLVLILGYYMLIIPVCMQNSRRIGQILSIVYGYLTLSTVFFGIRTSLIDPADGGLVFLCTDMKQDQTVQHVEEEADESRVAQDLKRVERIFCFLCQVHVADTSTHCRHCDKCVAHFDHHCIWLNTCIGTSNYRSFVLTIINAFALVALETTLFAMMFAEYFTDSDRLDTQLHVYASLSLNFYVGLVVTFLIILLPLVFLIGQFLLFHATLSYQGLTTYEYVLEQSRKQLVRENKETISKGLAAAAVRMNEKELAAATTSEEDEERPQPPAAADAVSSSGGLDKESRRLSKMSSWKYAYDYNNKRKQQHEAQKKSTPGDEFLKVLHEQD